MVAILLELSRPVPVKHFNRGSCRLLEEHQCKNCRKCNGNMAFLFVSCIKARIFSTFLCFKVVFFMHKLKMHGKTVAWTHTYCLKNTYVNPLIFSFLVVDQYKQSRTKVLVSFCLSLTFYILLL